MFVNKAFNSVIQSELLLCGVSVEPVYVPKPVKSKIRGLIYGCMRASLGEILLAFDRLMILQTVEVSHM
jgi:hypothetical protein